jgi:hypothetical protein
MTSVAVRLREFFDDHGVAYRIIAHEAAASADEYHAILGTRYEQLSKAIFLRCQDNSGLRFAVLTPQAHTPRPSNAPGVPSLSAFVRDLLDRQSAPSIPRTGCRQASGTRRSPWRPRSTVTSSARSAAVRRRRWRAPLGLRDHGPSHRPRKSLRSASESRRGGQLCPGRARPLAQLPHVLAQQREVRSLGRDPVDVDLRTPDHEVRVHRGLVDAQRQLIVAVQRGGHLVDGAG